MSIPIKASKKRTPAPIASQSSSTFWHRLLFPAFHETPALLKHPDYSKSCDEQIYAVIALICREHVLSWYSKLTRDRTFLFDITQVVVHAVQTVELRIATAAASGDLALLLTSDIPRLLENHVQDYHTAKQRVQAGESSNLDLEALFLQMRPHVAFDLDRNQDPKLPFISSAYLTALVDGLLAELLPEADYQITTERAVVREIVLYVILSNLFTRLSQPWFIHSLILKLLTSPASASAVPENVKSESSSSWADSLQRGWQHIATGQAALFSKSTDVNNESEKYDLVWPWFKLLTTWSTSHQRPILAQALWFFQFLISLIYRPLNTFLARFFSSPACLPPQRLQALLVVAEGALFPDGHPPASAPDPTAEEQDELKDAAERALAEHLPHAALRWMMPTTPTPELQMAKDILEPFQHFPANVLLMLQLLDVIVARLFPALTV